MLTHRRLILIALLFILGLIALAVFAPPDGQERGDLTQFFGNFHPLAVHFPIGLLLLVPLMEAAARNPRRHQWRSSIEFVLGLATICAIAAPYLGWLLARSGGFDGNIVTQHMWGGVSVAVAALLCWVLRRRASHASDAKLSAPYIGMLCLTVLLVAFTGYRGGQLAHGENHLTEHLPASFQAWLGMDIQRKDPTGVAATTFYSMRIVPIFEDHCLVCHSANKRKGGLRLDSYAGLIKGGKNGVMIKPGDARGSDLFRRVSLDPSHKDFMPAEGKPPLGDDDRKLLELWINAGASPTLAADAIAGAPAKKKPTEALAPDYHAVEDTVASLESSLKVRLLPLSQNPTDGLLLRTASLPAACDDATLAKLAPIAHYIVEAELARTMVTDAGIKSLAQFINLRKLDLSRTAVTSKGVRSLTSLQKLEVLNLTSTYVDEAGAASLKTNKESMRIYNFLTYDAEDPPAARTVH